MTQTSLISIAHQRAQAVALSKGVRDKAKAGDICALEGCRQPISITTPVYRLRRAVAHQSCVDRLLPTAPVEGEEPEEVLSLLEASRRLGRPYPLLRKEVQSHQYTDGVVKVRGKYKILASSCSPRDTVDTAPATPQLSEDQVYTIKSIIQTLQGLLE